MSKGAPRIHPYPKAKRHPLASSDSGEVGGGELLGDILTSDLLVGCVGWSLGVTKKGKEIPSKGLTYPT